MLLTLANFSLFLFSQPWTLPANIYLLIVCSQNELSPSSSKDKPLFYHQSLTLISRLCRALTQTKVHSEMSTPVRALKFHMWLFHTTSAIFLCLSLPLCLRAGTPSSAACRAQLNQWYGDFLILMPGHHCHFSPYLLAVVLCKLWKGGCSMLFLSLPHHTCSYSQGFEVLVLDWCTSGTPWAFPTGTRMISYVQLNSLKSKRPQKSLGENAHPEYEQKGIRVLSCMSASSWR